MSLEYIRFIILAVGWPMLIIGALYIFYNAYNFYKAVNSTPVAKLIPIFAVGTIVTMLSLGLVSTSFMMNNLEEGIKYVLPVFIIWFMIMTLLLIYSSKMNKRALKYNQLLKELERSKSDFLAMSSHQLRTPLSGIKWIVEILLTKKEVIENVNLKDKLLSIESSVSKMLALISNLLDIVRIETGKIEIHKENINIIDLLNDMVKLLEPNYSKNNQSVVIINNLDINNSSNTNINSDKTLLGEIIKNIISNAIEHGDKNSVIKITLSSIKRHIIIGVRNSGPTIPKSRQKKIFERYSREPGKDNIQEIGGLGLYLASNLGKMIGTSISVESGELNGTTFFIKIKK